MWPPADRLGLGLLIALASAAAAAAAVAGCHEDVQLIEGEPEPPADCVTCVAEGDCAPSADGTLCSAGVCEGGECVATGCDEPGNWVAIAAGEAHSCVAGWGGDLWCWGRNAEGELGAGDAEPRTDPAQVAPAADDWIDVTAGWKFGCGIARDWSAWCWGKNTDGQTGSGAASNLEVEPRAVDGDHAWRAIDAGQDHACAITDGSELFCWGKDMDGALGVGGSAGSGATSPVAVEEPAVAWRQVSAGAHHTCAVDQEARLYCWGANMEGQLGVGDTAPGDTPAEVGAGTSWAQVSAGTSHTCAVDAVGGLWCWGHDKEGQLAQGDDVDLDRSTEPLPAAPERAWHEVASGEGFGCAIAGDRSLWCWGKNDVGQLGLGDVMPRRAPVRVGTASDWEHLSAGKGHVCAVRASGGLYCWGDNREGQLAAGDLAERDEPGEACGGEPVD